MSPERLSKNENEEAKREKAFDFFVEKSGLARIERELVDGFLLPYTEELDFEDPPESSHDQVVERHLEAPPKNLPAFSTLEIGADIRLQAAEKAKHGSKEEATKASYKTVQRLMKEARTDIKHLNEAMSNPTNTVAEPDAYKIRHNENTLKVLAQHLHARQMLDEEIWPPANTSKFMDDEKFWYGAMIAASRFASEETLVTIFKYLYPKVKQNERIWTQKFTELNHTRLGLATQAAVINEDVSPTAMDINPRPPKSEPPRPEIRMPEAIRHRQLAEYANKEARIMTMVEQGWRQIDAEKEVLGGPAIWEGEGEDKHIVGYELPDEKVSPFALGSHANDLHTRRAKRAAVAKRRESGPSEKAQGEIQSLF